jgi:hypothetical protein
MCRNYYLDDRILGHKLADGTEMLTFGRSLLFRDFVHERTAESDNL